MKRLIFFFVALSTAIAAQTPARDTTVRPTTGTSRISGVVTSDDAARTPVRMATVRLQSAALAQSEMQTTDAEGRFDFANLPDGRFSVRVQKAGYVSTDYGAASSRSSGVPIVVGAGETATITVKLPRGGAIMGTLRGPDGEPAQGVLVWLLEKQPDQYGGLSFDIGGPDGWRGQPRTDDRGVYRFYGLHAGDYMVAAAPEANSGRNISAAELDWAMRLLRDPATANPPPPPPQSSSASYSSVYFPGVIDPGSAAVVTIAPGQERADVDFALQYQPTAKISGTMTDPNGLAPVSVQGTLISPGTSIFLRSSSSVRPDAEGKFSATGVVPGSYVLAIRGTANPKADSSAVVKPGSLLWALVDLVVDGRDQENIDIALRPGMTISGRVAFDGTTAKPPEDLTRVRVSASAANTSRAVTISAPDVSVAADGSFVVAGVIPGQYRLSAAVPAASAGAPGWSLRSAIAGGRDLLDYPVEMRPGENASGVVITMTDHATELTGTFVDAAGKPAPQYTLVVFTTDRELWRPGARRVRAARPGSNGSFRVLNLPPGEYYLAAVGDLEQALLYTPAFLEPLVASAMKITLTEGEKKKQDVRIAGK